MVDSIVGLFVAAMVSGVLYIFAHDYMGVADAVIWLDSMIGADLLGVACAVMSIRVG